MKKDHPGFSLWAVVMTEIASLRYFIWLRLPLNPCVAILSEMKCLLLDLPRLNVISTLNSLESLSHINCLSGLPGSLIYQFIR